MQGAGDVERGGRAHTAEEVDVQLFALRGREMASWLECASALSLNANLIGNFALCPFTPLPPCPQALPPPSLFFYPPTHLEAVHRLYADLVGHLAPEPADEYLLDEVPL